MGVYVNDEGTLRQITRAFVNDEGTLREITRFSVNDEGTLRHVFMIQVDLESSYNRVSTRIAPTDAFTGFQLHSDGTINVSSSNATSNVTYATDAGTWLVTGAAADYECMMEQDSGDTLTNSSGLDTWLACDTTRAWGLFISTTGDKDAEFTFSIRRASDEVVLATATVGLHTTVEA